MSGAFKLFRLQQVDSQLDEVQARLEEIEKVLGDDQVLQEARQAADQAEATELSAQKELKRAEEEVQAQQLRIEHNQTSLYSGRISNPKELQDLQLEAEALNRHRLALEDIQLEKMMVFEEAHAKLVSAQETLEATRAQRAVEHRTLGSEQNKLNEEKQRLESERFTAVSGISKEDLKVYQGLRKSKGGLAVAKVKNKTCSACGAELSASLAQAARSPNELTRCDNCKRILYAG